MAKQKTINLKLPKELWLFLKKKAVEDETTMTAILEKKIARMKAREERKDLTDEDTNV